MMQLETFFTVPEQTRLLIFAVLLGIPLGVVFDVLRTLRLLLPHGKLAAALEDVAFLLLWAGALLCFSTVLARGEFRGYYVMGNSRFLVTAVRWVMVTVPLLGRVLAGIFGSLRRLFRPAFPRCCAYLHSVAPKFGHFAKLFEKHLFFAFTPCREIEKCCIMIVEF